jgi:hypothetical protein
MPSFGGVLLFVLDNASNIFVNLPVTASHKTPRPTTINNNPLELFTALNR